MRFKQCYCILAFLLRGIDIDDYLAFDRIQPTIFQSTSLSPLSVRVSSILIEQLLNLRTFPIGRISGSNTNVVDLFMSSVSCGRMPCLTYIAGEGRHQHGSIPPTNAVAVKLL